MENKKRYIKSFIDNELDITVVEILDEDNISKDYFLFPENETIINNSLINNRIYISQYVERKELINARGRIKDISIIILTLPKIWIYISYKYRKRLFRKSNYFRKFY